MRNQMPGALVISLDFELHWGVRVHQRADGPYRANLLGGRQAVPRILEAFERYGIAATWAVVGFLFAASRRELESWMPSLRPHYPALRQDPYLEPLGEGEEDDPLHFAASLVRRIRQAAGQEIATHTFSHYYCREAESSPSSFAADLDAAVAAALAHGLRLQSIVFPRNQIETAYADLLLARGIDCYRGCALGWLYQTRTRAKERGFLLRAARFADGCMALSGTNAVSWGDLLERSGLCNVRASRFLRPYDPHFSSLRRRRLRRITSSLETAARNGQIYHLWWHPHNFGTYLHENLEALASVLQVFQNCRRRYGMQSLTMAGAARMARTASSQPEPPGRAFA
jgi:hypothetical protein